MKRMAKAELKFKARTVEQCWKIARREAEAIQRWAHKHRNPVHLAICYAARDAADRIALKIRYGRISGAGQWRKDKL